MLADRLEKQDGSSSLERLRAQDLLVDALTRNGKAGAPDTLALAERVVSAKEQLFDRDDLEIATSLHHLGAVHTERGEFSASIPFHERALSIRQKILDPNDPAVADSLDYLALPLIRLQRFADARQRLERSRAIREPLADHEPLRLARTLDLCALLERYAGNYSDASSLAERSLEIRHRLAPDHPEMVLSLNTKADIQFLRGDKKGAQLT